MSRDALVVGINTYQYLPELKAPASDAEAIAQRLEKDGDFHNIRRLPEAIAQTSPKRPVLSQTLPVSQHQLETALKHLFLPDTTQAPETALFYFSGHGIRDEQGYDGGYLATSDANPNDSRLGLSLHWLQWLLSKSIIKQQIVWLDCCHSGSLIVNMSAANPGNSESRDRCFIASSRDFESSWEDLSSPYSVLTKALLEGLDPTRLPGRWIDTFALVDHVNQALRGELQVPTCTHFGEAINLTRKWQIQDKRKATAAASSSVCPYKGLEYFNCNGEDPKYFFGREALTDDLIDRIRTSTFIAVVGASGSGKSSVLRAGLLHQLSVGRKIAGSEQWQILIMRPDTAPMQKLALAFVDETLSQMKRATAQKEIEETLKDGADGLIRLVNASAAPRVVLLIDQFEEVFTCCHDVAQREQFFACILNALENNAQTLRIVISMRADFLGKCLEKTYSGLSQKIQKNLISLTPMTEKELRLAICKPAEQVGLKLEPSLVTEILRDIEGEPGLLPLLQYTLKEIWKKRSGQRLTLESYLELGRIEGTLEKQATEIYDTFSPHQKKVVKHIFLSLTQLGEGTGDTRRRVPKQDLIDSQFEKTLVDEAINKLADNKLIVTAAAREKNAEAAQMATVEVAHEALIRHWSKLREWIDSNRDSIRRHRYIEDQAREWVAKGKKREYLMRGSRLSEVESVFADAAQQQRLPETAKEFIQKSIRRRTTYRDLKRAFIGAMTITLVGLGSWTWSQRKNSAILRASESARLLMDSNKEFDSLLEILKSVHSTNTIGIADYTRTRTNAILRQIIYSVREKNRLEGHLGRSTSVNYSPDGETLVSTDSEGLIKIWQKNGSLLKTFQAHSRVIWNLSFNPTGETFASASADGTVKIWQSDGILKNTLEGHGDQVLAIVYSADGKRLFSAGKDGMIKLWDSDGNLLKTIQTNQGWIYDLAASGDNRFLASSGKNGTVKLWTIDGTLVKTMHQAEADQNNKNGLYQISGTSVWSVAFSPDSQFLAAGSQVSDPTGDGVSGVVALWTLDGTLHQTYQGHRKSVTGLSFSPDGQMLISSSYDKTIKLWNLTDNRLNAEAPITLVGHREGIWDVDFHPDGKSLASASRDKTVRIWQREWLAPTIFEGSDRQGASISVDFSPDGKTVASASERPSSAEDSSVNQWQINLWQIDGVKQAVIKGHLDVVTDVEFSPSGEHLASASADKTIKLWKLDGSLESTLEGHTDQVFDVDFSPDGKTLVSASADETARIWTRGGVLIATLEGHNNKILDVEIDPSNQLLATASSDNDIKLWSLDGKLKQTLSGHENSVYHLSFSPDGKVLASASADSTVRLWSRGGKPLAVLQGPKDFIFSVSFSPNGQVIAAASADGEINFWHRNGLLIDTIQSDPENFQDIAFNPASNSFLAAGKKGIALWDFELDKLSEYSCRWIDDYLASSLAVTSEVRELCPNVEISAAVLLNQGRDLARKGEIDKAVEKFEAAFDREPELRFPSVAEAERLSKTSVLLADALKGAREDYDVALAKAGFAEAVSLDPALIDAIAPEKESKRLVALALMETVRQDIEEENNLREILNNLERAKRLYPRMGISADFWHSLCQTKNQKGHVPKIIEACNNAIISDPKDGRFYDSRAISKLLSGAESAEIISDLERFITWAKSNPTGYIFTEKTLDEWAAKREKCAAELKAQKGQAVPANQGSAPVKLLETCQPFNY